ncbi:7815_t:CDS:2, partial [Cetraspora pellucida]
SRSEVVKAVAKIKKRALETGKKPTQLIQDNMNSIPEEVRPYMPMLSALHRVVTHARKNEELQEPQKFAEDNDLQLMPTRIITNFKLAPINASHYEFLNAVQKAQEIPVTFEILKVIMPSEASNITQWFEEYYVLGKSIYDSIELGIPRTQNVVEVWHHCWKTLVRELN